LASTRSPDLRDQEAEIERLRSEKEKAIADQKFEEAAALRDSERIEREKLHATVTAWKAELERNRLEVSEEDIMQVISKWTGVPLQRMDGHELTRMLKLEDELAQVVVGQQDAVSAISRALRRSRADLKDPKRPIGSFIFLGPTGVGKTLLAKTLAECVFGDRDALIQIDMSEYMEKFNVSRLVGSPPGYVGHDEGGQLTERVRRRPYSVVLFDEVEKAHPDVMHMLLQILEEGKLTDSVGRQVDFRNTVVILTSNLGHGSGTMSGGLGFSDVSEKANYAQLKQRMLDAAKRAFKPEFLNRIDEIIVFRELSKSDVDVILDLELQKVRDRVAVRGWRLQLQKKGREFLLKQGYNQQMGARPLRRALSRYLEDPLAEKLLREGMKGEGVISITEKDGKLVFTPKEKSKKKSTAKSS
jgi:ATP-dependent Clp protease ATP-binding subunit ClpC